MIAWRVGEVTSTGRDWNGAIELQVLVEGESVRALAYPRLVGSPIPGDTVLLNTTAQRLGLGTGGYALVVAIPSRLPADPAPGGHLVKGRYLPTQATVLGADEQDSPHHQLLRDAETLDGMPVVIADLHSALPAILVGVHLDRPQLRVAYVMTDGGALAAWFSRTLSALAEHLVGTVTVGQAVGGDLEAVTVHTGLLAAQHVLKADIAIVTQGPGNLGTGTTWGFSGVAAGDTANAVHLLEGQPVGALRISDADPRSRHRGVSHHSLTAFGRVALCGLDLAVPEGLPAELSDRVEEDLAAQPVRNRIVHVSDVGLLDALTASPVPLSTMGRGLAEDPWYFLAAAAAGRHAAGLVSSQVP
ncbi:MAG: DUF3866 family protein [Geodermatophilaceae bacterium]|nr:DUF3866 family protein [Geodermatophilaceae bacterium]MDQ3477107.1 DUF3866 family protein [Actinomycetota bacterium]